jgi:hypothetical protein
MRLIDADALKERILKERDAIPKTVVERYSFGVGTPNQHGNSMRGGIRKALRCMEQTPTIDPETLRPKGRWDIIECDKENKRIFVECECGATFKLSMFDFGLCYNYCPNCGADMREG